ncbi:hypothetical protein [Tardiphaga sp. 11_C7_N12_6]|uniref:hypothetical protein n=1 Tax=Tardiphaga sp. 11_C7_N12_6 TaxID=3240789 RepID=UPI003F27F0C0
MIGLWRFVRGNGRFLIDWHRTHPCGRTLPPWMNERLADRNVPHPAILPDGGEGVTGIGSRAPLYFYEVADNCAAAYQNPESCERYQYHRQAELIMAGLVKLQRCDEGK